MPVILVPGFLTGDWSMRLMATTLKTWGLRHSVQGSRSTSDARMSWLTGLSNESA